MVTALMFKDTPCKPNVQSKLVLRFNQPSVSAGLYSDKHAHTNTDVHAAAIYSFPQDKVGLL